MLCVSSDGFIFCTVGPFMATENDASIMKKILPENIPAMRNFEERDVMLVDRGFRDCVEELESYGFIVRIPAHASGNRQLSTIEANRTRLVTKCRFQVERMNGVFKNTFKIFSMTQETYWIPSVMHDLTIAAALINRLKLQRPQQIPPDEHIDEISRQMLSRLPIPNVLHEELAGENQKIIVRRKIEFSTPLIFPKMSMEDLEKISFGIYQINQAKLYAYDHMQVNGGHFKAYTFPEECKQYWANIVRSGSTPALIMLIIKSRFVKAKEHNSFVAFNSGGSGFNEILGYFCMCKNGLRTLGCSHIMTILFYFGFAQYNGGVREPSPHLRNVFDREQYRLAEPEIEMEAIDTDDEEHFENDEEIFGH